MKILNVILTLCCASFFSACIDISSDSTVFITNNSAVDFRINVNVLSDESPGFMLLDDELAAYEAKPILRLERASGLNPGQDYALDIVLTGNSGEEVVLSQKLLAENEDHELNFSIEAQDINPAHRQDNALYRYDAKLNQDDEVSTSLAFKAEDIGRYKDVFYAITPNPKSSTPSDNANQLSLITYNVWALPPISTQIAERLEAIPQHLSGVDVIVFQELFASERTAFLQTLSAEYPYQTRMLDKPGANVHDGGVTIISRYPIVTQDQFIFPDCSAADCLADKGINYAEIIKNGRAYHIFAAHMASFDTAIARSNRQKQFTQMRNFALSQNIPASETVIYAGDLNVNKLKFADDYQQMLATLRSIPPQFIGYSTATFDPEINILATTPLSGSDERQYLDYVLISQEYLAPETNTNDVFIPRSDAEKFWQLWDLSDHFPVKADIQ